MQGFIREDLFVILDLGGSRRLRDRSYDMTAGSGY